MSKREVCYMSLIEQAEAIRTRELSPVEVVDAVLDRIERLNPRLNAYCTVVADAARQQAKEAEVMVMRGDTRGPLHGVPIGMKDIMLTKGIRTTFGSKMYEHFVPGEDATVVERLKAAGAILVGKTNVPEFALSGLQTENLLFGATRNPWNLAYSPGGSSGGSAVAVTAGMGSLGIGSDSAGSIRMPASFCGVFGFKASFGRVPRYPRLPAGWETVSHTGPITRTVRDTALAMEVIAGRDDRDFFSLPDAGLRYLPFLTGDVRGLRIAWARDLYAPVDPRVMAMTEAAAGVFETLGAAVEVASPRVKDIDWAFTIVSAVRMAAVFEDKLAEWRDRLHPNTIRRIEERKGILATEYVKALMAQLEYWDGIRSFFETYDLMLTPTTALLPPKLGQWSVEEIGGVRLASNAWRTFGYSFNVTGQPAASVPCGWTDDGFPVGLQIVGRRFDDLAVLNAAAAFERASPWIGRRPPLEPEDWPCQGCSEDVGTRPTTRKPARRGDATEEKAR